MSKNPRRILYFGLGILAVALGVIGVFLPVLPTTPFLLLAAYFFERSSQRAHTWLMDHPQFGPPIRDWNQHRIIRPRVKWVSVILIWLMIGYPVLFKSGIHDGVRILMLFVALSVSVFLLTRKSA